MASLTIAISEREMKAIRNVLDSRQYKQANYQATKRATRRARVMLGDTVRSRLTIRKKFIDSPSSKDAAIKSTFNTATQAGSIVTTNKPLPLSEFKHSANRSLGVSVTIDSGRPPLMLKHAFKATVRSVEQAAQGGAGHKGIFLRKNIKNAVTNWFARNRPGDDPNIFYKGGEFEWLPSKRRGTFKYAEKRAFNAAGFAWRLPIQEQYGLPVFGLVKREDVLKPALSKIHAMYRQEWENQISRFTGGRIKSLGALTLEDSDTE